MTIPDFYKNIVKTKIMDSADCVPFLLKGNCKSCPFSNGSEFCFRMIEIGCRTNNNIDIKKESLKFLIRQFPTLLLE